MKIQKILINILKWTLQTVLLSLLPLFFYILIHWMFKLEENPIRRYISELYSFTLVISSSVAIELSQKKYKISSLSCVKDIIFMAYLPLLIIFFVIYGIIYYYLELDIQLNSAILNNMFLAIKIICTIHFIIAFLLQIIGGFYGE